MLICILVADVFHIGVVDDFFLMGYYVMKEK